MPVDEVVAAFTIDQLKRSPAAVIVWNERVSVRQAIGTRIAMRTGRVHGWRPAESTDGLAMLPALSSMPPYADHEPYLAVDFQTSPDRQYILAVESIATGGDAQFYFQERNSTTAFGDFRVTRTNAILTCLSEPITPATAGAATAYFGWHGFEDGIVAASIYEVQL
jgi:hypothetical protein